MPAGEETLKDIEKKAAGEVASLFGDKSRKIAILAESPVEEARSPTSAMMGKYLPILKEFLTMLGYQPYIPKDRDKTIASLFARELEERYFYPSGEARRWTGLNKAGKTQIIILEDLIPPLHTDRLGGAQTAKSYAKRSTRRLLDRAVGRSWKQAKQVDPAFSEKVTQFFDEIGTELEQQPEVRSPTFVNEAEWFKRYMGGEKMLYKHPNTGEVTEVQLERPPWAEVEVYPYYGEEELLETGKKISEKYGEEQISLGIFGHAGRRFGGVPTGSPSGRQVWREAFQDVDIDTAFIGACRMTQDPKTCESIATVLSKPEKETVVLATNFAWGTSPGYDPEEPSVKVAFQKGADIGVFKPLHRNLGWGLPEKGDRPETELERLHRFRRLFPGNLGNFFEELTRPITPTERQSLSTPY
jgi:hypothetical protein